MIDSKYRSAVLRWLYLCSGLIALMVVVGGYVRLSRAGLSIVEWDVVMGVLPPIGESEWQEAYDLYKASPEGQTVNADMDLAGYQRIFFIEWFHRLLARAVGLVVALPLIYFLARGIIPRRQWPPFVAIGLLFAFQGFLGWYMVASGLVDKPSVSHYRLTIHLLAALLLLALCLWKAADLRYTADPERGHSRSPAALHRPAQILLAVTTIQIAWGGLVAGLKAGHVSNTWPLMFGQVVPAGTMGGLSPAWRNVLDNMVTVHFLHRWFAWVVVGAAVWIWLGLRQDERVPETKLAAQAIVGIVLVQVLLGILTVLLGVPLWVALAHQATAVLLFGLAVFLNHRLISA